MILVLPIATPIVPTPTIDSLFVFMPTLYDPSIPEDVVDNPEIEIVFKFSKLWGLSEKTKYSPLDCPGYISTFWIILEATLILLTDLPFILVIFADTPWPWVPLLLKTRVWL